MTAACPPHAQPAPPPRHAPDAEASASRPREARFAGAARCASPQGLDPRLRHPGHGAPASPPRTAQLHRRGSAGTRTLSSAPAQRRTTVARRPIISAAPRMRGAGAASLPADVPAQRRVSALTQPGTVGSAHRRSSAASRLLTTARARQRACPAAQLDERVSR
jgi:hypothetical protein